MLLFFCDSTVACFRDSDNNLLLFDFIFTTGSLLHLNRFLRLSKNAGEIHNLVSRPTMFIHTKDFLSI